MTTWNEHKQELMKNADFKAAYANLEPEYRLAREIIKARLNKKLTQTELAEKAGVSRAAIARLESGTANARYGTVTRVFSALDKELRVVGTR